MKVTVLCTMMSLSSLHLPTPVSDDNASSAQCSMTLLPLCAAIETIGANELLN